MAWTPRHTFINDTVEGSFNEHKHEHATHLTRPRSEGIPYLFLAFNGAVHYRTPAFPMHLEADLSLKLPSNTMEVCFAW
jgi:hypothetical protein